MKHLSEEQLILFHYGEAGEAGETAEFAEVERHLATCGDCAGGYAALKKVLAAADDLAVPERGEDYGEQVWERLQPRLATQRGGFRSWLASVSAALGGWTQPRRLALAGAMAAVVIAAFFIGRISRAPNSPTTAAIPEQVRERILLVTVGEHLERSQMVLVELANATPQGKVDISTEQQWAEELVDSNRLYRQTAAQSGQTAVASVLEELERLLLEIARGPSQLSAEELKRIQERMESQGILFKVRVLGSKAREAEAPPKAEQAQPDRAKL